MQTEDDPETQFDFRTDGTGLFTISSDGYVELNGDELDYEKTKQVSFMVMDLLLLYCFKSYPYYSVVIWAIKKLFIPFSSDS